MAKTPSNELVIYAATGSKIWKTINGGTNWQVITGTLPVSASEITAIAVKNDDPNTVWVTMSGYNANKVFQSTVSSGASWVNISTGLPPLPVNTIVQNKYSFDEVHLFVGTDVGVYFKKGANDWIEYNTNLPNVKIGELEIYYPSYIDSCVLRAATYGRGLWRSNLYDTTLGTSNNSKVATVNLFPNPASTEVNLSWDNSENVTLRGTGNGWIGGPKQKSSNQQYNNGTITINTAGTYDINNSTVTFYHGAQPIRDASNNIISVPIPAIGANGGGSMRTSTTIPFNFPGYAKIRMVVTSGSNSTGNPGALLLNVTINRP